MTSPAHPLNPTPGHAHFLELCRDAQQRLTQIRKTRFHALTIGVDPEALIRYARGDLEDHERNDVQHLLTRSPWAMSRVVALVKSKRNPSSLGARILRATQTDPYAWGMKDSGDRDMDLAALLELVECNEDDDPST